MSLSTLPFDVLLQIITCVGTPAILSLLLTNHSLHALISVHEARILPILLRPYHSLANHGFNPEALEKSIAAVHTFRQLARLDLACELAQHRARTRPSRQKESICYRKELGLRPLGLDLLTRLERGIWVFEGFVKSKAIVIKDRKVQYRLTRSMSLIQQYNEVHNTGKAFLDGLSKADVMNFRILYYCAATAILTPSNLHCEKCWEESRNQNQVIMRPPRQRHCLPSNRDAWYLLSIATNHIGNVYRVMFNKMQLRLSSVFPWRRRALSQKERIQDLLRRAAPMNRDQWSQICFPVMLKMKIWDLRKADHEKALAFCNEVESFAPPGAGRFELIWPY